MNIHSQKESSVNRKFSMRIDFIIHWQRKIHLNCMQRLFHIIAVTVIRSVVGLVGFYVCYIRSNNNIVSAVDIFNI